MTVPTTRRAALHAAMLSAGGWALPRPALAQAPAPAARAVQLGPPGTLAKARLDNLVATWHAAFNAGDVLRPFNPTVQGAGGDVVLRLLTTRTALPGTGESIPITGLLAVPAGAQGRIPVVSWQHGTIFGTQSVPSNLTRVIDADYVMRDGIDSAETLFNIQRLASNGFAVIAADYVGKGPYGEYRPEAYLVREVSTRTCLDMLDAGIAALGEIGLAPGPLFLNGWSQGALNTQWLAQALQRDGRAVRGAAASSPFNDLNETLRFWTGQVTYPGSAPYPAMPDWGTLAMVLLLGSYQVWYGLGGLIDAAIRTQFRDAALTFWNAQSLDVDPAMFPKPDALLAEGFFDRFNADVVSGFLRQLAANRATFWDYALPMRLFYGLADEAIHPALARQPLAAGGRKIDGAAVPRGSHRITFLASLYGIGDEVSGQPDVLEWFRYLMIDR